MSIEIKELHFKFNLERRNNKQGEAPATGKSSESCCDDGSMNQQELVAACVDEVLRILEYKSEER
jgi:hypothetical protein